MTKFAFSLRTHSLCLRMAPVFLGMFVAFGCNEDTKKADENDRAVNGTASPVDANRPPCASAIESEGGFGGSSGEGGSVEGESSRDDMGGATGDDDWSTLNGSYYLLEHSSPYLTIGVKPVIQFRGSRLAWDICNSSDGDYVIEEGVLVMDSVNSTAAQCDPHLAFWEYFMASTLTSHPAIRKAGDNIVLTTADDELVFAPGDGSQLPMPDAELERTVWQVIDLASSSLGSLVCYKPDPSFMGTLVFEAGDVTITAPCNIGSASYEVIDAQRGLMAIDSVTWTKHACPDDAAWKAEQMLQNVFAGTTLDYRQLEQQLMLAALDAPEESSLRARVSVKD